VPLDFDPGSRTQYSNFGYIVLGEIAARVCRQSYEECVRTRVLKPMGINGMKMHDHQGRYHTGEARRYNAGFLQALPAQNMPWTDAAGGWSASAVDLARMMTAVDGSRTGKSFLRADVMKEMLAAPSEPLKPRPDGSYFGLGWDAVQLLPAGYGFGKSGCWPGVRSSVKHRVDGLNTVILSNAVVQLDPLDMKVAGDAIREAHELMSQIKEWPKTDLFDEYR
jgi:N-acyl-D-amino-acid deacylase